MSTKQLSEEEELQSFLKKDERQRAEAGLPLPATAQEKESNWGLGGALPILSYCVASIMMTVINKFVVSGRDFNMIFLLCAIQSAVCVVCVVAAKRLKFVSFRDFDKEDARRWMPVSLLLVGVIYTSSKSLQFLRIPVYTIFKNLTTILIAYGEVIWFGGEVTGLALASFCLMVLSSFIAAWSDITDAIASFSSSTAATLDPTTSTEALQSSSRYLELVRAVGNLNSGYIWVMVNCIVSASYVLFMRKRIKTTGFKDWDTMFYNNLLSIPFLVVFSFLFESYSSENLHKNFPTESGNTLMTLIIVSGMGAAFISYCTAWCVRTTSSTTFSMTGALNKLPVAASGMIFFGDPVTVGSVSAVSTGFVAGIVFAIAKQNQARASRLRTANGGIEMGSRPR
ncbi:GDP-mannose transporter [Atractiella rhizophila]|nr:GDP-mannose transporter [Atractiella rhizophila]